MKNVNIVFKNNNFGIYIKYTEGQKKLYHRLINKKRYMHEVKCIEKINMSD